MSERELRFTDEDMALFAAGSGDSSPLHTDAAFAQRTSYGSCIVYGGLLSIALLGSLPDDVLVQVRSIRSSFPEPVLPEEMSLALTARHPSRDGVWEVRLQGRGRVLARLVADTRREEARADAALARATASTGHAASFAEPTVEAGEAAVGLYRPGRELRTLVRRFDSEALHPALLDGIGWASYAVGMGMPGFQGLCAAVAVTTAGDDVPRERRCARAWLLVRDHDERSERRLVEGVLSDDSGAARTVAQIECFPISMAMPLLEPNSPKLPAT